MNIKSMVAATMAASFLMACGGGNETAEEKELAKEMIEVTGDTTNFVWSPEKFADIKMIRYQIPGWEKLTAKQRMYAYHLTQAGYEGRDIIWDQNYRHNLAIRKGLESIYTSFQGNKETTEWKAFDTYVKRVWFSNGIHHHYSMNKIIPGFTQEYLHDINSESNGLLTDELIEVICNPEIDAKKVSLDPKQDLLLASATNFYGPDVTEAEAIAFYKAKMNPDDPKPISYGLNSKLVKSEDGTLREEVFKSGGLYGAAIDKIVGHLEEAIKVAENQKQADALKLLIEYYNTGDLKTWDAYNIAWVEATEGDIDYINSFIEVYNDPIGYRGSFESVVEINDFEASERMATVMQYVQWFEDNSTIMDEHKKANVKGVTYKVVNVAGESGDASPSTPIGVNLPNANWIRTEHGSKSVSLGNLINAYDMAGSEGILHEFAFDSNEVALAKAHSVEAGKLHTALHEVVGHASGKINPGVGTPKETLKNYSSTLEEARADLVALYFMQDPKLMEIGLMSSMDVGKAEYSNYIRNGLMLQLRRIEPGDIVEEAHMRNRQLVAAWAYEKGQDENVIEKKVVDGKTYFVVNDYAKLRVIFGELLKEIQRIKSEGDYEAGMALVENYGVQVDQDIHAEVLARTEHLNIPPYGGFINPELVPIKDENGTIIDVKVTYPASFAEQMLHYATVYGNL